MHLQPVYHPIQLGLKSLALHKLRTGLTLLGVVFGVGSVIVMLAIGEGVRHEAVRQIQELGATNIILRSVKPTTGSTEVPASGALRYGLTLDDLRRIETSIPTVAAAMPLRDHRRDVWHGPYHAEARVVGVTSAYGTMAGLRLRQGRFISPLDLERLAAVVVLGAETAEILFPIANPIGESVRIGEDQYYTVVGVVAPRAASSGAGSELPAEDYNRDAYVPFTTDQKRFGEVITFDRSGSQPPEKLQIRQITVTVTHPEEVQPTAQVLNDTIRRHHRFADTVTTVPLDLLEKAEQTQRTFTWVLSAIAAISLLVGGIGIMNIMLATVTERTREIGLRRALGARRQDILFQFLIETLVLTTVGGLLGIGLGLGLAQLVTRITGIATLIRLWSPLIALGISVGVGVVFGLYPARRAALMDPIEALRHE